MTGAGEGEVVRLWDFCLRIYARPEVAKACLDLQEHYGANVPLLLAAAWLGSCSVTLTKEEADRLGEAVRGWNEEVVKPLRALRTRLKAGPAPAPDEASARLREKVKTIELEAERIEIEFLESLAAALPQRAPETPGEAALANLGRVLPAGEGAGEALRAIAQAAASLSDGRSLEKPGEKA
ncbi:TIGR02444 family protein [Chelativorans sp.]|uniref:TIGR02444 family protein n=1 Tax=Chelativorans sp. TaxID=2203393 RepID=UPI00281254C8|nr:TIGR02444 family protein [Chelativorans sp.]